MGGRHTLKKYSPSSSSNRLNRVRLLDIVTLLLAKAWSSSVCVCVVSLMVRAQYKRSNAARACCTDTCCVHCCALPSHK